VRGHCAGDGGRRSAGARAPAFLVERRRSSSIQRRELKARRLRSSLSSTAATAAPAALADLGGRCGEAGPELLRQAVAE
jgi:hypothetical protein